MRELWKTVLLTCIILKKDRFVNVGRFVKTGV